MKGILKCLRLVNAFLFWLILATVYFAACPFLLAQTDSEIRKSAY